MPGILAATWSDGVFVFEGDARRQELAGKSVRDLAPDQRGSVLAIVDRYALCLRTREGVWSTLATSQVALASVIVVGEAIYLGTDDARVLCVDQHGQIDPLNGFGTIAGRDSWYAGSAVITGQRGGPPLGVRSMTATADGSVLLVNVHVGGIPRSTDGGVTWHPTIDVRSDVHEVCAHPLDPHMVIAAAAIGLCISRDGGASWIVENEGLHSPYCSAVAFSQGDIFVAASTDHFADHGAVYRRPIDGTGPLQPVRSLPRWLGGIVDTGCIATRGRAVAIADKAGNLYASADAEHAWLHRDDCLPMVSKVLLI